MIVDKSQHELVEKICAEHISSNVKLNWTLGGTENKGIASLKGISLSPTMLDLITVSPLQWGNNCLDQINGFILITSYCIESNFYRSVN